ncbi:hypothetical protein BGZ98_008029 [Dissophora globulifera]|nr:hypothetical protein BGZ98_008029 [Dissophora globulifera]
MGWAPMGPDLDTCGMTNWVGSFDPIKFIYFMLATVLIPYPVYILVATVFNWEHRAKRPARHYQDILHATSYGLIVFIFGNYTRTLNWITILAFWMTWPIYSQLIAELDFAKTSLPSWKTWPFGMYALFAGATVVILLFAGYHIYLGIILNKTVPGFIGYYLLALLVPVILTLIGYVCLKQQNNDLLGLSKFYNFMLKLQWKWGYRTARRKAQQQKKIEASKAQSPKTLDTATTEGQAGTVVVQVGDQQPSALASLAGSRDNLISTGNNPLVSSPDASAAAVAAMTEQSSTGLQVVEPEAVVPPFLPYVWSAAVPGYFHPHHWQIFYTLAFFTRFDTSLSRVGAGIVLGCYMQGIMAYGFDYLIEE